MSYLQDLKSSASRTHIYSPPENLVLLESEKKLLQESFVLSFIEQFVISKALDWSYKTEQSPKAQIGKAFILVMPIIIMLGLATMALQILSSMKRLKKFEKRLTKVDPSKLFDWKIYLLKSEAPNAWTYGTNHMFITSALYTMLDDDEILAVCLHEAGHAHHFDVPKNIIGHSIKKASLPALMIMGIDFINNSVNKNNKNIEQWKYLSLIVLMSILVIAAPSALMIFLGKRMEYAADGYAAKKGYGKPLISALEKMEKWITKAKGGACKTKSCTFWRNMGNMLDVHPPVKKRIEHILKQEETYKKLAKTKKPLDTAKSIVGNDVTEEKLKQAIEES